MSVRDADRLTGANPTTDFSGLVDLQWWAYPLVALGLTHVTIAAVTIYLHRHQTHRALELHPSIGHAFRFWLWLTTGMVTREWVAVHRKHHARCERYGRGTPNDWIETHLYAARAARRHAQR